MLKQIKTFYIDGRIPQLGDWQEAVQIAKTDNCVVELRWCPNTFAGWWHEYVFENSDPAELDTRTPRVYGI
jgi:hypothetical protein